MCSAREQSGHKTRSVLAGSIRASGQEGRVIEQSTAGIYATLPMSVASIKSSCPDDDKSF